MCPTHTHTAAYLHAINFKLGTEAEICLNLCVGVNTSQWSPSRKLMSSTFRFNRFLSFLLASASLFRASPAVPLGVFVRWVSLGRGLIRMMRLSDKRWRWPPVKQQQHSLLTRRRRRLRALRGRKARGRFIIIGHQTRRSHTHLDFNLILSHFRRNELRNQGEALRECFFLKVAFSQSSTS